MKIGQKVKLHKDIRETTDLGVVAISKDESGTIFGLNNDTVQVEFTGPYTLNSNGVSETIIDKVKLKIDIIKAHNYFMSASQ
jgi:hypothetical protein